MLISGGVLVPDRYVSWHRDVVAGKKFSEVFSYYPIVTGWQSEGVQLAFFNPSQYCCIADPAMPGNKTNSHIFRVPSLNSVFQIYLPLAWRLPSVEYLSGNAPDYSYFLKAGNVAYSLLAVNVVFEVWRNGITTKSQSARGTSQKYHTWSLGLMR